MRTSVTPIDLIQHVKLSSENSPRLMSIHKAQQRSSLTPRVGTHEGIATLECTFEKTLLWAWHFGYQSFPRDVAETNDLTLQGIFIDIEEGTLATNHPMPPERHAKFTKTSINTFLYLALPHNLTQLEKMLPHGSVCHRTDSPFWISELLAVMELHQSLQLIIAEHFLPTTTPFFLIFS